MTTIILFIIYIFLSSSGLILFKYGSQYIDFSLKSSKFICSMPISSIIGIICYMASFVLWLVIVNKTKLSLAMPISVGLVNILVLVGAFFVLKEQIGIWQWVGALIIITGLIVLSIK